MFVGASSTADSNSINLQLSINQTKLHLTALYNSVNHVLHHKNCRCYTEHFVLPKWRVNVRVKERNVIKQYQIVISVMSALSSSATSVQRHVQSAIRKHLGSTRSAVEVKILHTQTNVNSSIEMAQRRRHTEE